VNGREAGFGYENLAIEVPTDCRGMFAKAPMTGSWIGARAPGRTGDEVRAWNKRSLERASE
jgi:hypothetical protein